MNPIRRYLLILPILLGAFFLLYDLEGNPIWSDEYFTYAVIFEGDFPARVFADIHPPLYYILAFGFTHIVPAGFFALRFFSVVCGLVSIYLAFLLCRRHFGQSAAMILLILLPINCHLILFSRMARYYIPLMLFVLLVQLAFERLLERRGIGSVVLYTLSLTLCFYINLVSLLIIPAYLAASALRRKGAALVLAGQMAAIVLLLPWVPTLLHQLSAKGGLAPFGNEFPLSPIGFIARILWPLYDFSFGENIPPWDLALSLPAILAVVSAFIWFLTISGKRGEFIGYILWVLVPLAILTGAILPVGMEFLPPRASFLLPFWLMIIAAGISRMPRNLIPLPIIILVVVSIAGNIRYFRAESTIHSTYVIPWEEIAVEADRMAGNEGLIISDDESLRYYLPDDPRLMFLAVLEVDDVISEAKSLVLVVNPRDITPGGLLTPFVKALEEAGYEPIKDFKFVIEDEKTRSLKQKILRREVSRAKKEVRLYEPQGGVKE